MKRLLTAALLAAATLAFLLKEFCDLLECTL